MGQKFLNFLQKDPIKIYYLKNLLLFQLIWSFLKLILNFFLKNNRNYFFVFKCLLKESINLYMVHVSEVVNSNYLKFHAILFGI